MTVAHRIKPKPRQKASPRRVALDITQGMQELEAWMKDGGPAKERFTVHTVVLPAKPGVYDANTIRATRERIGASQAVFALLVGVSAGLVRAWEQGQRVPSLMGRRLLDEINRDPKRWLAMLSRPRDKQA